jgi:hypothetical protein
MAHFRADEFSVEEPQALILDRQAGRIPVQLGEERFGPKAALGLAVALESQPGLDSA